MKRHSLHPKLLLAVAALLCCAIPASASQIFLSDLLSGGSLSSISSGDKLFDNFRYNKSGNMPTATQITVVPTTDIFGNYGLDFVGPFLDLPGSGGSDALIQFRVHVTDPAFSIVDAHLFGNPSVVGGSGSASVTETFLPQVSTKKLSIFDNAPGTFKGADGVMFDQGYKTLDVQKDILLLAGPGSSATLSVVTQSFSQVPEPASFGMLGFGALGLLAQRRRRS